MNPFERTVKCRICGRKGERGFVPSRTGKGFICKSDRACALRLRRRARTGAERYLADRLAEPNYRKAFDKASKDES